MHVWFQIDKNSPLRAPFAELVRLSDKSVADELHEQHTRRVLGD
jgi:hypothetical protein